MDRPLEVGDTNPPVLRPPMHQMQNFAFNTGNFLGLCPGLMYKSCAVARKPRNAAAALFSLKFADNIHYKFKSRH